MSKSKYVVRQDGMPFMFTAESEFDLMDTNEIINDYPYILKSMKKENYYLENELCNIFNEILFENKVVGFATYEFRDDMTIMLTECYILPEFRGNMLFFNEICKMLFSAPKFGILQPTCNVVELLCDYSFAKNVTEDIVVSGVPFYFDDFDARSNKRKEIPEEELPMSNFYDLGISSTIFVDANEIFYHELLENDLTRNGKRKKLTKNYFKKLKKLFSKNMDEFEELIIQLENELPREKLGYSVIVGDGEGLSEFMQEMIDDGIITYEMAVDIKEQLKREYQSGEIDEGSIEDRMTSLVVSHAGDIDSFDDFKRLVDLNDDDENLNPIRSFIDVIGDNDELGNKLYNALLEDNDEEFHDLIIKELNENDDFLENFLDYADEFEDELTDGSYLSYSPFGFELFTKYKLDDTIYGKDYPKSYDLDIYSVLSMLDEGFEYWFIMEFFELEVSSNPDLFTSLILQEGYVQVGILEIDWLNSESDFTKKELQEILGNNNLKTKGAKTQLLKRLADNDVNFGETLLITQKGEDYLKEYSWIRFYKEFLLNFDFNDYCKFRDCHEGTLKDVSLSYLDYHIEMARKNDDEKYIEDCMLAKKSILEEADEFLSGLNIPE